MLEHRSVLRQLAGCADRTSIERPGFTVRAPTERGWLLLQGDPGEPALQGAVAEQLGLALPAPRRAVARGELALLWMAPREWLLEVPRAAGAATRAALEASLSDALTAVTDLSDGLAAFDLAGPCTSQTLMSGCGLELHPRAFGAGHAARTTVAGVPTIIWRSATGHECRCIVDRSLAGAFWHWLAESPAATGSGSARAW